MKSFGVLIEEARRKRELTLRELGKLVGIAPSAISEMEHGNRLPPANKNKIFTLAQVLRLPKAKLYEIAVETREVLKGGLGKELGGIDSQMAFSFYRAMKDTPEDKFKEALEEFLKTLNKDG